MIKDQLQTLLHCYIWISSWASSRLAQSLNFQNWHHIINVKQLVSFIFIYCQTIVRAYYCQTFQWYLPLVVQIFSKAVHIRSSGRNSSPRNGFSQTDVFLGFPKTYWAGVCLFFNLLSLITWPSLSKAHVWWEIQWIRPWCEQISSKTYSNLLVIPKIPW